MGCSRPVMYKLKCKKCGEEICRFCNRPKDFKKRLSTEILAYRGKDFSAHVKYFLDDSTCAEHAGMDDLELVTETMTNSELIVAYGLLLKVSLEAKVLMANINHLRTIVQPMKINFLKYDRLNDDMIKVTQTTQAITNDRCGLKFLEDPVSENITFCNDKKED